MSGLKLKYINNKMIITLLGIVVHFVAKIDILVH